MTLCKMQCKHMILLRVALAKMRSGYRAEAAHSAARLEDLRPRLYRGSTARRGGAAARRGDRSPAAPLRVAHLRARGGHRLPGGGEGPVGWRRRWAPRLMRGG